MKEKFLIHMSNDELLEKIAGELVQMHVQTGIDLNHWPTALELVRRFYTIEQTLVVKGRKADLAKKKPPQNLKHESLWKEEKHRRKMYENQINNKRSCSPDC